MRIMRIIMSCPFAVLLGIVLIIPAICSAQGQSVQITSGPTIESADDHSATIAWSTNVPSSSQMWYGTDMNNLTQVAEAPYSGGTHRVQLNNLTPVTTYYFQVESGQGRGARGEAESQGVLSFRTPAVGQPAIRNQKPVMAEAEPGEMSGKVHITNGPIIEKLTDNSATIAWSTDKKGSSRVSYGTDSNNLTKLGESPWGEGGLTHRVELRNLQPNTTYYFNVETGQAQGTAGAEVESQRTMSFKTPPQSAPAEANVKPQ
jgi:phosphodiesterase/alkaline phosphatase D-like protein